MYVLSTLFFVLAFYKKLLYIKIKSKAKKCPEEKEIENMALTRKFLTALGVEAEKVDEIINAHTETVDALKEDRDKYKADAEKLPAVQGELDNLKATMAENDGKNPFEVKYNEVKDEFEQYKASIEAEKTKKSKEEAYKSLLLESGISEKRLNKILQVSSDEIEKIELDAEGKIKNSADLKKNIEKEWEDFIVKAGTAGANVDNPPDNSGGATMTKEEIFKIKDASERQKAIADNHELFGF